MMLNKLTKELEKVFGMKVRWGDEKIVINGLELIDEHTKDNGENNMKAYFNW